MRWSPERSGLSLSMDIPATEPRAGPRAYRSAETTACSDERRAAGGDGCDASGCVRGTIGRWFPNGAAPPSPSQHESGHCAEVDGRTRDGA